MDVKLLIQEDIKKDLDALNKGVKTIRIKPKLKVIQQLEENLL